MTDQNEYSDSDLILLLSNNNIVTNEVSNNLNKIAKSIQNKKEFIKLSDQDALHALTNGNNEASEIFRQLLVNYGHFGSESTDPLSQTWAQNPLPCVKNIKLLLSIDDVHLENRIQLSSNELMESVKSPLSVIRKFFISKFLLQWTRDSVRYREISKDLFKIIINNFREELWYLANQMARKGLIPEKELLFYLNIEEIDKLCREERDPLIVMKAIQRKRIFAKMKEYKFEEFLKGFEMNPINVDRTNRAYEIMSKCSVQISGTPVSNGKIKARVCVCKDVKQADKIKPGDILITYSTDTAWGPYFPIISGMVTEMGGLISHEAIIAREFGIPCLISCNILCAIYLNQEIFVSWMRIWGRLLN